MCLVADTLAPRAMLTDPGLQVSSAVQAASAAHQTRLTFTVRASVLLLTVCSDGRLRIVNFVQDAFREEHLTQPLFDTGIQRYQDGSWQLRSTLSPDLPSHTLIAVHTFPTPPTMCTMLMCITLRWFPMGMAIYQSYHIPPQSGGPSEPTGHP